MALKGSAKFEMPPEMRALAEKSVEQARQAFDTFIAAASQAATAVDRQACGARAGARGVGELAVRFAEHNIASSFEFAQRLLRAKDAGEAMALHADYVKQQIGAFSDQAKELSKEAAKLAGAAAPH